MRKIRRTRFGRLLGAWLLLAPALLFAQQYAISTIAGGAPPPTPVTATSASLGNPAGVATDAAGNVYFASLHCVFKMDSSGTLTRIAGNSRAGFSGDGGAATSAQLFGPEGLAIDASGNLFIADIVNHRIRKVSPNGIITTVAGTGTPGYSGDGGPAAGAQLNSPGGVTLDASGNLFIADILNHRIRQVSPNGIITTVAGNGKAGFSGDGTPAAGAQLNSPAGVAVDASGNLFIADPGNQRIRKVSPGGIISTVTGNGTPAYFGDGGPAAGGLLRNPLGVAVDGSGNLLIADSGNYCIRKVSSNGIITTVAGNGTRGYSGDSSRATNAQLSFPTAMTVDASGSLFIADNGNNRFRKVSPAGIITTVAGNGTSGYSGDGGPATSAQLAGPSGMKVDATGNLFIADILNHRIRKISPNGIIATVAGNGTPGYSGDVGPATSAQLTFPSGVAFDASGNLFIADTGNSRIRKILPNGIIFTVAGGGTSGLGDGGPATIAQLDHPYSLAFDGSGNLFIADSGNARIRKIAPNGTITTVAGGGTGLGDGGAATSAQLNNPIALALDASGNLFIVEYDSFRVRRVSPNGIITTFAGNGTLGYSGDGGPATSAPLNGPAGVAVDSSGKVFIADTANNAIRAISPSGTITTVAGNGIQGYSGDGGLATGAQLYIPYGVAVDASGKVFIADTSNNAIRVLTPVTMQPPSINSSGIVDAAGYKPSVSPGGMASVYGANFAAGNASAATLPLPTTLGSASLTLGGKQAPLFFASSGQMNFQVPWELAGQTQSAMVVTASSLASSPQTAAISAVSPGIFTADSSGSGQAIVTITATGQLAAAATPAPRGQYITIYCSGLGAVSNQPATGAASPASPVANTTLVPTVTIGGAAATSVQFSGLTPGLVGLYQVNVLVPSGAATGQAVPLTLTVNGVTSNTVTIAVQ